MSIELTVPVRTEILITLGDRTISNRVYSTREVNISILRNNIDVLCSDIPMDISILNLCQSGGGSCSGDSCRIGVPSDSSWDDGAANISPDDTIADGVDKINELLKELLPEPPLPLDALTTLTTVSGYLSVYSNMGNLVAGSLFDKITDQSDITLQTVNNDRFSDADKGNLIYYKDDNEADSLNLENVFNPDEKDGCQSALPLTSQNGKIELVEVCKYNNFSGYQRGKAKIHETLSVGYNKIKLVHQVGADLRETPEYVYYYDDGPRPFINNFVFSIDNISPVIKYLSGVKYYGYGTKINVNIGAENVFNKTYVERPIEFWASAVILKQIAWNDSNSSGYNNPPHYDDLWSFSNNNWTMDKRTSGSIFVAYARGKDPFGYGVTKSTTLDKTLYNTYDDRATDKHEFFTDELYRLPIGDYDSIPNPITGQWDSSQLLTNGNAQVFVNRLIYPHQNFTVDYRPQPQSADYSGFSGDQVYIRAFRDSGIAHNSGSLHIRNITWDDVGSKVDLFIKLPTQTGWLDLSKDFSAALFTGADGDGAMVSHSQSGDILIIDWTSGTFSTANSGWLFVLKIVIKDVNIEITELYDFGG